LYLTPSGSSQRRIPYPRECGITTECFGRRNRSTFLHQEAAEQLQSTHSLTVARLAWCSHPMRVSRLIAGTVCCYFDLIEPRCSFVSSSWTVVFSSHHTDVRNGTFWL